MSKAVICPAGAALIAVALTACGGSGVDSGAKATGERRGPLEVVTTIGMIADLAAGVAGPHAVVDSLMGPGVDPHLYKASESDVRRLAEADLVLYNGLHLEGKMGDVLVKMARSRPVVAVSESVPPERLREPPEFLGQYDPHIWFDVSLWRLTLEPIVRELSVLDPAHADEFQANARRLGRELDELDAWAAAEVARLPPERRVLVTAHDAFGYFGQRYGMEVVGLQGISTLAEAGLKDVERVVDLVVTRRVPAIFIESSVPRRAIEAVQAAAASRGHRVAIGGQLFSDAMGAAGTPEGSYEGMVRSNVTTIVAALLADADANLPTRHGALVAKRETLGGFGPLAVDRITPSLPRPLSPPRGGRGAPPPACSESWGNNPVSVAGRPRQLAAHRGATSR